MASTILPSSISPTQFIESQWDSTEENEDVPLDERLLPGNAVDDLCYEEYDANAVDDICYEEYDAEIDERRTYNIMAQSAAAEDIEDVHDTDETEVAEDTDSADQTDVSDFNGLAVGSSDAFLLINVAIVNPNDLEDSRQATHTVYEDDIIDESKVLDELVQEKEDSIGPIGDLKESAPSIPEWLQDAVQSDNLYDCFKGNLHSQHGPKKQASVTIQGSHDLTERIPAAAHRAHQWIKNQLAESQHFIAEVAVCKGWDGIMNTPWIGLALPENATAYVLYMVNSLWCYGRLDEDDAEGFFPRAHVRLAKNFDDKYLLGPDCATFPQDYGTPFGPEIERTSSPCVLAPRTLPPIKFADWGHSTLTVQLSFHPPSTMDGLFQVNFDIKPNPRPPRRVACVILELTFRGNEVLQISPEKYRGSHTESVIETTSTKHSSFPFNENSPAAVFLTYTNENRRKVEVTRISQDEIDGSVIGGRTVRWMLKEDDGVGGRNGIPHHTLSAYLRYRPMLLEYRCEVMHVEGVELGLEHHKLKSIEGVERFACA
ncbi:hypothetical protein ONZ45_g15603 [Pleurotus djamor]|nr:hypothetical protein ONZ45_g15603 [Pleurotus djamor]